MSDEPNNETDIRPSKVSKAHSFCRSGGGTHYYWWAVYSTGYDAFKIEIMVADSSSVTVRTLAWVRECGWCELWVETNAAYPQFNDLFGIERGTSTDNALKVLDAVSLDAAERAHAYKFFA
jgi:hypothetical protein